MTESQIFQTITKENLVHAARQRKQGGWQLTQISATAKDIYDLLYTFERDYDMVNLRVELAQGDWIESVTSVYSYAYLYENEIHSLFGIDIRGMNVDFEDKLYRTGVKAPFGIKTVESESEDNA